MKERILNNILVVDDEPDMLSGFASVLKALGYIPYTFSNPREALDKLRSSDFQMIFCDLQMPEMNGMEFLKEVKRIDPALPIIIFTAYGTINRAVEAMKYGAYDFIEKPVDTEKLKVLLHKGIKEKIISTNLNEDVNIIGNSSVICSLFNELKNVSSSDANILLTGESGTGKELIARSIHTNSRRKNNPFIPVNSGSLPEQLFEAELFGYEKGAFTGASQKKLGLLEIADGGTFFLDEVCELPLNLQVKMLRVLQDNTLRRLGGNEMKQVNFRVISATNRDPEEMILSGKLRRDFYYRINVIQIKVPPLRDREGDIELLAKYFLEKSLINSNKIIKGISKEAIEILNSYDFPGNVRELGNVIEHAVTFSSSDFITPEDLPSHLQHYVKHSHYSTKGDLSITAAKNKIKDEIEKKYLTSLLKKYKGNISKMSSEAGMTRRNIHRLLKIHNIDPDEWRV